MTRRDRASLVLALEAVRLFFTGGRAAFTDDYACSSIEGAVECLGFGGETADVIVDAIPRNRRGGLLHPRLTRARLALLLRAALRAEGGIDVGARGARGCSRRRRGARCTCYPWPLASPLWLDAREHSA